MNRIQEEHRLQYQKQLKIPPHIFIRQGQVDVKELAVKANNKANNNNNRNNNENIIETQNYTQNVVEYMNECVVCFDELVYTYIYAYV